MKDNTAKLLGLEDVIVKNIWSEGEEQLQTRMAAITAKKTFFMYYLHLIFLIHNNVLCIILE